MSGVIAPPDRSDYGTEGGWRFAQAVYGLLNGQTDWGTPVALTSYNSNAIYAATIQNQGASGLHLNVPGLLTVTNSGVSIGVLSLTTLHVSGNADIGGTLGVTGATTVGGTLGVTGATTLGGTLGVTGATTLAGVTASFLTLTAAGTALLVNHDAYVVGDLRVDGVSTLATVSTGALTVTNFTATGNVALGDANTDTHTIIGVTTFRNTTPVTQLFVDAANNRVIVHSGTALGSAANDVFTVVGGISYFVGTSGPSIGIRYVSTDTVGWTIGKDGAGANQDLLFLDDGAAEILRIGDTSSTYQAKVTGALDVTNGITLTGNIDAGSGTAGQIRIGAVIINTASLSATEVLRAHGDVLLEGTSKLTGLLQSASTNEVLSLIGTTQTLATVGAAGGASALPATPLGYIKALLGATSISIPYYNR